MKTFMVLALLCAMSVASHAQQKQVAVLAESPAWVDPGWRYNLNRETVSFDEKGVETRDVEFDIVAQDERGARAIAQQIFSYDSYLGELDVFELATVKQDGRIIPVDPRAIADQPSGVDPTSPYFNEYRVRVIAYSDVQALDRVRGRVTIRGKKALIPGHVARVWSWSRSKPPGAYHLRISLPVGLQAKTLPANVDLKTSVTDGRVVHEMTFNNDIPAAPSVEDGIASSDRFELSSFVDYAALAAAMNLLNEPMAKVDDAIKAMSNEIIGDTVDRRIKASKIHNWVTRNIRYVGIGLQDGGYKSQPAAAVLASRYGDCKAHATLTKALLAAQGIEANFILINSDDFSLPMLAVPSFDHAILYLPEFDLFADPTAQSVSFGTLPMQLYAKPVLNIDKGSMMVVPRMRADNRVFEAQTDFVLGADGRRKAQSTFTGFGVGASMLRSLASVLQEIDRREVARQELKSAKLDGTGDYIFQNPRVLAESFTITSPFEITRAVDMSATASFRLYPFTSLVPALSKIIFRTGRGRASPCFPLDYRETTSLTLPAGTHLTTRPENFSHRQELRGVTANGEVSGSIVLRQDVELNGDVFRMERRAVLTFDAPICPASFSEELDAAFAKWDDEKRFRVGIAPNVNVASGETGSKLDEGLQAYHAEDYATALALLTPFAEQGETRAQLYLGYMYHWGKGVEQNPVKAVVWHEKAAAKGNTNAEVQLAWAFDQGTGVKRNLKSAAALYERAALKGSAYAQNRLGIFYRYGSGVVQNYSLAAEWLTKAVEQGYGPAHYELGIIHERGLGVPKDLSRAAALYREAVKQGSREAKDRLSVLQAEVR